MSETFHRCRHFTIEELVDQRTVERFGQNAWMLLNPNALRALDDLRDFFDRGVTVNNWKWGGRFRNRALRIGNHAIGAEYSQHRLGNAFDCDVRGMSAEQARQAILTNKDHPLLQRITCIEAGVNWLHFDCRNIADRIRIVNP